MGSCGANRREFEDQSAIKGKFEIKWDKTKLVSHFFREGARALHEERRKEEKKKKKRKGMCGYHGFLGPDSLLNWLGACAGLLPDPAYEAAHNIKTT